MVPSVERLGLGEELGVVVEPSVTSILSRVRIQLDFVSDQKAEVKVQKKKGMKKKKKRSRGKLDYEI